MMTLLKCDRYRRSESGIAQSVQRPLFDNIQRTTHSALLFKLRSITKPSEEVSTLQNCIQKCIAIEKFPFVFKTIIYGFCMLIN